MNAPLLHWLPKLPDWSERIGRLEQESAVRWEALVSLANSQLDFLQTERLDRLLRRHCEGQPPADRGMRPVRLAVLGSSTVANLQAPIRIAALRRGIRVTIYENAYGQYHQELLDRQSALHRFRPDAVLFALDARHVAAGAEISAADGEDDGGVAAALERAAASWLLAQTAFRCPVIQQTLLPVFLPLLGNNEHRLSGSPARFVARFNDALRARAENAGVHLLSVDDWVAQHGLRAWHNPVLWHRAKQEVNAAAATFYGDLVARLLAALQGRSYKCLVLDLDNTIWGGVVGDDGVEGLILGQGTALGEAYSEVQQYASRLGKRGVILAVCSKNDQTVALSAFENHPEMVLKSTEISCFKANWVDKASNLRAIADELNIGLNSLVFVDDNPFERNLVRQELPVVAVPEIVDDDPAMIPVALADAGYFEALSITQEDITRTAQYRANRAREELKTASSDISAYLRSLNMELVWSHFDRFGLPRITQLINKTNQFNLTTRRYREEEVVEIIGDSRSFGLQFRLLDRFGDNGIIAVVIGRSAFDDDCVIETWLMSCRVLGRQVEEAMLNVVVDAAKQLKAKRLIGNYIPTAKNAMVANHYAKLDFDVIETDADGGGRYALSLKTFVPHQTTMQIKQAAFK